MGSYATISGPGSQNKHGKKLVNNNNNNTTLVYTDTHNIHSEEARSQLTLTTQQLLLCYLQ